MHIKNGWSNIVQRFKYTELKQRGDRITPSPFQILVRILRGKGEIQSASSLLLFSLFGDRSPSEN